MSKAKTVTLEERERIWHDLTVDLRHCLDKISQLARVCLFCDCDRHFLRAAMGQIWKMGDKSSEDAWKITREVVQGGTK